MLAKQKAVREHLLCCIGLRYDGSVISSYIGLNSPLCEYCYYKSIKKMTEQIESGGLWDAAKTETCSLFIFCPLPLLCQRECFSDLGSHTQDMPHSKRAQTGQTNQIPTISVCQQLSGTLFLRSEWKLKFFCFDVSLRSISRCLPNR